MKNQFKLLLKVLAFSLFLVNVSIAQEHKHGEEDGSQLSKNQTYNVLKKGVRLILKYNKHAQAFIGTIENKTPKIVRRARVEVHLSNGIELGPTNPKDLKPNQIISIKLSAKNQNFITWNTHAEVGSNEHGHSKNGEKGEHNHRKKEGKGEHASNKGRKEHR